MAGVSYPCASSSESLAPTSGWPENAGPGGPPMHPGSHQHHQRPQRHPWTRLFVAIAPWMLASGIATATMSAELAPRADETELPQMQSPPPPPPAAQPGHSEGDDVYFDPTELIAV